MGVDAFRDLGLNEKARVIRHSKFAGQRIAVDANNVGYIQMSIATKEQTHKTQLRTQKLDLNAVEKIWMMGILNFLEMYFLSYGILPLMVFDGPPRPEKLRELQKRTKSKKNPRQELDELEWQIESCADCPEEIPMKVLKRYKQLLINTAAPTDINYQNLELVLNQLGLPTLHAKHDSEELCAMLTREGHAVASYSTDTDSLVFGTKLWLKSVDRQGFVAISKKDALEYKQISFSTFVEICITAGNDFFKIDGVSMKTAERLIMQYRDITGIPMKYDVDIDAYHAAHKIFSMKPCEDICEDLNLEPNPDIVASNDTRDILSLFGIPIQRGSKFYDALNSYLNKKCSNGEPEDEWDEL